MTDRGRAGRLLAQLIAIDSVNPDMPGGRSGENEYGAFVGDYCDNLGLSVERIPVIDGRANVLAVLGGGHQRTLLFDIHLDTVPQEGPRGSVNPVWEGSRVYGRGACDVKGSMAAALLMLERLAADPPPVNVALAAVVDEEYLKRGAWAMAEKIKPDAVIVAEPTGLEPVIAQKGVLRFALLAQGRSAHTANPGRGRNAIYAMLDAVGLLRALPAQIMPAAPHPLCGEAKLTVSTISGGTQVNVVPADCEAMVDRRMLPGEDPLAVHAAIADLLSGIGGLRLAEPFAAETGVESSPSAPVVKAAAAACASIGGSAEPIGVPYSTDAAAWATGGFDFVVLGPGDIANAHSANEYIEICEVETCVEIYERTVREFAAAGQDD